MILPPSFKILVVGETPSNTSKGMDSPSIKRLNAWMDYCNVRFYSFDNLNDSENYDTSGYNKVITLGQKVAKHVKGFHAPHPSPRNRKWNIKNYEERFLEDLYEYIWKK